MTATYHSTRSREGTVSAKRAILEGLAGDGGLYVTDELNKHPLNLEALVEARRSGGYLATAQMVLEALLDDYSPDEIGACVREAYQDTFASPEVTPVVGVGNSWILELFRGPTSAFKDVALQMLPRLMSRAAENTHERILVLTATSGDTGKAALDGFADVKGVGICVFYPEGGTSQIQRLQMVTQKGRNVAVAAVRGNFDDAQSAVKRIFGDVPLRKRLTSRDILLSSANSINIGRLAPQVVYYFDAYAQLVIQGAIQPGDQLDFCVPTGNFGDVLAGYYAQRMGLKVHKLIVASNANKVLTEFLTTGVYDRNRPFFRTISPSMDILVSSNLERLLYYESGGDCELVRFCMDALGAEGRYEVPPALLERIRKSFACGSAHDDQARTAIRTLFEEHNYLADPHTAVAWHVSEQVEHQDGVARVVLATASPYKFCRDVCEALELKVAGDDFACMRALEAAQAKTGAPASAPKAPKALAALENTPVRFNEVLEASDMAAYVERKSGEIL